MRILPKVFRYSAIGWRKDVDGCYYAVHKVRHSVFARSAESADKKVRAMYKGYKRKLSLYRLNDGVQIK